MSTRVTDRLSDGARAVPAITTAAAYHRQRVAAGGAWFANVVSLTAALVWVGGPFPVPGNDPTGRWWQACRRFYCFRVTIPVCPWTTVFLVSEVREYWLIGTTTAAKKRRKRCRHNDKKASLGNRPAPVG